MRVRVRVRVRVTLTPPATSLVASCRTASYGLERKLPRKPGIAQKLHAWSHPSATRR